MNSKFRVSARFRTARTRLAAGISALGLVAVSTGLVMITAPAAQAAPVPVCHATNGGEKNPYNYIQPAQSAKHDSDHDQSWGRDGAWWHGTWHEPNSIRPELDSDEIPDGADPNVYCNTASEEGPRTALPAVDFDDPSCANENVPSWSAETEGVTYERTSGTVGPSQPVTVTATALDGYVFSDGTKTMAFPHTFAALEQPCPDPNGTTGALVDVDFTEAGCGIYGTITQPTGLANVTYSIEDGVWTGLSGERDVTATLINGARAFDDQSTQDWTVNGTIATQTINVGTYVEACGERTGALVDVDFTEAGCGTYGTITQPTGLANVTYSIEDGVWTGLSGEHDVTATLTNGARAFNDLSTQAWVVSGNTATQTVDLGTYVESCDTVAGTIGDLGTTPAGCNTWGSITEPANPVNVDYSLDRGDFGNQLSGVYVVTAELINNATEFTTPLPADWFLGTGGQTATRTVDLGTYTATCGGNPGGGGGTVTPTNVTPLEPSWTEPTCSTPAGVEYRSVDGVAYVTEGDVAPGKRAVVRSEALTGHSFADGTVTWWAHTFDTPQGCDAGGNPGGGDEGEEPSVGTPSPTVKGVQKFRPPTGEGDNVQPGTGGPHAVPTAVAAGLTDFSGGHGSPSTFSSPQLAQALVAGGLLLLVVGGGLGLGRRTNGAHEF